MVKSDPSGTQQAPESFAQTTPDLQVYGAINVGQMVFELQGTVGEIKEAVASLARTVEKGFARTETTERNAADIKIQLGTLAPKIDDVVGFVKHGAPNLAKLTDLGPLKIEIEKRPTRRQSILDVVLIVGLIATILTIGSRFAH